MSRNAFVRAQRHVVAAVVMLAVVGGGGVMWLLLHSAPVQHLTIGVYDKTVQQGGDVLLYYNVSSDIRECSSNLIIGASNGIEYTVLYEGDMVTTEMVHGTSQDLVVKKIKLPDDLTPGKTRIDVNGKFACSAVQRWKPHTVGLGNVVIDVKDKSGDKVTELHGKIGELRGEINTLQKRVAELELIDELRLRYEVIPLPIEPVTQPSYLPPKKPIKKATEEVKPAENKLSAVPTVPTEQKDLLDRPRISKKDLPEGFTDWIGNINLGE